MSIGADTQRYREISCEFIPGKVAAFNLAYGDAAPFGGQSGMCCFIGATRQAQIMGQHVGCAHRNYSQSNIRSHKALENVVNRAIPAAGKNRVITRSEEHTSELQSRLHLVCRLLLEKK